MFLFVENLTFLDKGPSSFAVEKGECVGLTGRSGIGKTQLFLSLPGMMTGQILGGTSPAEAVTYQILIMFLIAGGTGVGVFLTNGTGSVSTFLMLIGVTLGHDVNPALL